MNTLNIAMLGFVVVSSLACAEKKGAPLLPSARDTELSPQCAITVSGGPGHLDTNVAVLQANINQEMAFNLKLQCVKFSVSDAFDTLKKGISLRTVTGGDVPYHLEEKFSSTSSKTIRLEIDTLPKASEVVFRLPALTVYPRTTPYLRSFNTGPLPRVTQVSYNAPSKGIPASLSVVFSEEVALAKAATAISIIDVSNGATLALAQNAARAKMGREVLLLRSDRPFSGTDRVRVEISPDVGATSGQLLDGSYTAKAGSGAFQVEFTLSSHAADQPWVPAFPQ